MTAITIRHVPQQVRNELAARAASSGSSLQNYLLQLLIEAASRPTADEVIARARERARASEFSIDLAFLHDARSTDQR